MGEPGLFEFFFPSGQDLSRALALRQTARRLLRKMHKVPQAVLSVIPFGAVAQPAPIQMGVRAQDSRAGFTRVSSTTSTGVLNETILSQNPSTSRVIMLRSNTVWSAHSHVQIARGTLPSRVCAFELSF